VTAAWGPVLDEYERRLDAFEALLAGGHAEPLPPFEPPPLLEALTGEHLVRATHLLERSRELEARGDRRLAETPAPTRLPPLRRPLVPRSHRIDTSA
jgi:hypothetical protein